MAGKLAVMQAFRSTTAAVDGTLLLFASGAHGARARAIAEGARELAPRATIAVVGAPRIATGDDPDVSVGGVSAIALPMRSVAAIGAGDYSAVGMRELGRAIGDAEARPALLFGRHRPGARVALGQFVSSSNASGLSGALGIGAGLAASMPGEDVAEGDVLAVRFEAGASLVRSATSAVEPLVPYERVSAVHRGYVERVGDRRALDWLRESGRAAPEGRLLLVLIKGSRDDPAVVRGVAGIEPTRGAIHLGEDVAEGELIAVGALSSGRLPPEAVERASRRATRGLRGGAARAAILVDPSGRAPRASFAEAWDFGRRFGEVPWVGLRAASQIVTVAGKPRLAQHMATLSIVGSAS